MIWLKQWDIFYSDLKCAYVGELEPDFARDREYRLTIQRYVERAWLDFPAPADSCVEDVGESHDARAGIVLQILGIKAVVDRVKM